LKGNRKAEEGRKRKEEKAKNGEGIGTHCKWWHVS
jgi:hypothetical protein